MFAQFLFDFYFYLILLVFYLIGLKPNFYKLILIFITNCIFLRFTILTVFPLKKNPKSKIIRIHSNIYLKTTCNKQSLYYFWEEKYFFCQDQTIPFIEGSFDLVYQRGDRLQSYLVLTDWPGNENHFRRSSGLSNMTFISRYV